MVYYYTSGNIKLLRNIILDYGAANEVSPNEYMETYMEKCPDITDDAKITWIVKTFIDIQKHVLFLQSVSSHLSEELSEEGQDFFQIVFHAVIFQIRSKDMQNLYKCLFNLSKPLLNTFTKFLGNNEVLTYISQVAQSYYDATYITEKIVAPLFSWQPYISEMGHAYGQYIHKIESRKIKPKTIPVPPSMLNRKPKESTRQSDSAFTSMPQTPPNSVTVKKNKKMLTKSVIDEKLKSEHEKHVQQAKHLLNDVKRNESHYAQVKTEKRNKTLFILNDVSDDKQMKTMPKPRQKFVIKHNHMPVKETATTLKRMNKRVLLTEQDEVQWLADLIQSCETTSKVDELIEYDKREKEKERMVDIERKHLMGQISHEEALIAKNKVLEENKKKYEEFIKEKESWNEEIECWKKEQMEKSKIQIEKLSLSELSLIQARNDIVERKKENAEKIKKESEAMRDLALKKKQEELEKRITMIKEIKILALIAKKSKVPKIIDLTETSGFGFLCEMSMAELQERLTAMKISIHEELEQKRKHIQEENLAAKQDLEQTKEKIKTFMTERAGLRKRNKKSAVLNTSTSKEIMTLKKVLEDKRKLRIQLTT